MKEKALYDSHSAFVAFKVLSRKWLTGLSWAWQPQAGEGRQLITLHRKCGPPSLCPMGKSVFNSDLNEEGTLPAKRSGVQPSLVPQHSRTRRQKADREKQHRGQSKTQARPSRRLMDTTFLSEVWLMTQFIAYSLKREQSWETWKCYLMRNRSSRRHRKSSTEPRRV